MNLSPSIFSQSIVNAPEYLPFVQAARNGRIPGFPFPDGYSAPNGWDEDFYIIASWTQQSVALHKNASAADFGASSFDDIINLLRLGNANPQSIPAIFCCGLNRKKPSSFTKKNTKDQESSGSPRKPESRVVRSIIKLYAPDARTVISLYAHSVTETGALRELAQELFPAYKFSQTPQIMDVLRHPGYLLEQLKSLNALERKSALIGLSGALWCVFLSPMIWHYPWIKCLLPVGFVMIFLGLAGSNRQD
jgi:hypothetical protein